MESFEMLARQYAPMIHKIIRSLNIYKNQEEFYQIGLIALWEASEAFLVTEGKFASFAFSYIKGRMLTELEKSKKWEERNIIPQEEYWDGVMDEGFGAAHEQERLRSYCSGLTAKQAKWLMLTYNDGLSVTEIAASEHVSPSAVKQWKQGALKGIRRALAQ